MSLLDAQKRLWLNRWCPSILCHRRQAGKGCHPLLSHVRPEAEVGADAFLCALQIHSPRTTVREALQFSADLRFNGNPGRAALQAFVDEVMDLVELHPNRNSLVSLQRWADPGKHVQLVQQTCAASAARSCCSGRSAVLPSLEHPDALH